MSQAACPSQQATPVATVPRVQVAPASVEYARKMLAELVFEKATRLFVLVGLTSTKLSAWLPSVALTFTTGSRQANGATGLVGTGARPWGFMLLRGGSGTWMAWAAARTWACKLDGAGGGNAKP